MSLYSIGELDLRSLYQLRESFTVLPSCQREFVWKLRKQQGLIDTILRGLPVPPLAYIEVSTEWMGVQKKLLDGQQRWETIMRFFRDEFPTARYFSTEEVHPICPGKRYSELPPNLQSAFDNYKLPMVTIVGIDDAVKSIGLIFRRWQGGEPLTFAEKLYSYDGVTKDIANILSKQPFWADEYQGNHSRKQPFQCGIKLLLLEARGTFANLTSPQQVYALTTDANWSDIPRRMTRRFETMVRCFKDAHISSVAQVVLAYQTIMLLEDAGFVMSSCEDGCFTKWFMKVKADASMGKRNSRSDLFVQLDKVTWQRSFWGANWDTVCQLASAGKRDPVRLADMTDKLNLWVKQDARCPVCNKELRFRDGVAHHIKPYAEGGHTQLENMVLVHDSCHRNMANAQQVTMLTSVAQRREA